MAQQLQTRMMEELDMSVNMELSDKDKQLLYIVVAIAILAAAFFFGYRNFSSQKDSYKEQAQQYNDQYASLIEYQKNRENYKKDTAKFNEDREAILNGYEVGYNQENMIKTLNDIEKDDSIWFKELSFAQPEEVYTFTSESGTIGVSNATTIGFAGGYTEFKSMLASVLGINSKTKITTLNVTFDEANQILEGELGIEHYSLYKLGATGPDVNIDLPVGVTNIFDSNGVVSTSQTQASNGSYILTDYDVCMIISPDKSTFDSVILGTTNDDKAKDSVTVDDNATVEATITFNGSDGKYTVSYTLGDKKYPAKNFDAGAKLTPGDTLDLLVLSSPRDDNKDKVSVKANLINNTDMKLNVLVSNDDTSSPRFSAAKKEGEITIYR